MTGSPLNVERGALGALVAGGFLLRLAGVDRYGLNPDEAQFVWLAAADTLGDVWQHELAKSPHPPANFFMLHVIQKLSWSPFWLRLPSVLSGTFLIWISHRFTRQLFGPGAAIAAAFLVTFSPALIDLSRVCRNYAPGFALLVAALVFFAAFLERERWRDYVAFACLAPLAAVWHYGFVAVFVGIDLALAAVLWRRRRPLSTWLRVAALQLPLAAVLLFLYLAHVSALGQTLVFPNPYSFEGMLGGSVLGALAPLAGIWRYLMLPMAGSILQGLSGLAVVDLWIRGRRRELALCVLPIGVAYVLALASLMPLGASRHSAYLFPFLFALAASQLPQIRDGYRETRSALRRRFAGMGSGEARPWPPVVGGALVSVVVAVVLGGSHDFYWGDAGWSKLSHLGHTRELMTSYPQADVERAYALLEEHFGQNDIAMLSFQGLMALRVHLQLAPRLDPLPGERAGGDLRIDDARALRHEHRGVRYFWSAEMGVGAIPSRLARGVQHVGRRFDVSSPDRIWLIRSAWERSLADLFDEAHGGARYDTAIHRESGGMLFAIDFDELRKVSVSAP